MDLVGELIPTRQSLLSRLKDWSDQESWRVFFETYWKLIYNAAIKAGLTDTEAQDVVQETVISVMKAIPRFNYDPVKGSFKSWLMRLAAWRVVDQFRKRQRGIEHNIHLDSSDTDTKTPSAHPEMEIGNSDFERAWEEEWENNLLEAAIERTKKKVDPKHYQAFDLYVLKKWPALKVARTLRMNAGSVYLVKHRISNFIKKEIQNLRTHPIQKNITDGKHYEINC